MRTAVNASIIRQADQTGLPLLVIRLVLGCYFLYTGWVKAMDPMDFLREIHAYGIMPETPAMFMNSIAIVLPWLEIVCGLALVLGAFVRGSAGLIALMFCVFTPAIFIRALAVHANEGTPFFEIAFDCGCGTGVVVIWKKLLANILLMVVAIAGVFSRSRRFCVSMWFERRKPDPSFCHLCGYAVRQTHIGLCDACATPPEMPTAAAEPA